MRFVQECGEEWRFVAARGCWLHWSGSCWKQDETAELRNAIRHVCRNEAGECEPAAARRIASNRNISAIERNLSSDPALATKASVWDADPMLLNTPDGVIDLRTGECLGHDRDR